MTHLRFLPVCVLRGLGILGVITGLAAPLLVPPQASFWAVFSMALAAVGFGMMCFVASKLVGSMRSHDLSQGEGGNLPGAETAGLSGSTASSGRRGSSRP